jgi:predicted kinase
MKQFIVIIRGTPASGKSTIAQQLRNFNQKIAWLKVDNFKPFFEEINGVESLKFVNQLVSPNLIFLVDHGFSVVIDGVFQDFSIIHECLKIAKDKNIIAKVFEIKCSLETLIKRDVERSREIPEKKIGEDTLEKIYQILQNNPLQNSIHLDTENLTVEECANQIIRQIASSS